MRHFYFILLSFIFSSPLMAETNTLATTPIAIINARILPVVPATEIDAGTVLIEGSLIVAVGKDVDIPANARIIDAAGKVVTPGLVVANTNLGIAEINGRANASDAKAGSTRLSAGYDASYAVNCRSTLIPIARLGGITRAIVVPDFNAGTTDRVFAGQGAVINLGSPSKCLVTPRVGVAVDIAKANISAGRGAVMVLLNSALDDARLLKRNSSAYERGKLRALSLPREDLEALLPVIKGEIPLLARVDRASDIIALLDIARRQNIKLILEGAAEGWLVADSIAAAKVPVVLDANNNMPLTFDRINSSMDNAARLYKAGVVVVIRGEGNGHFARNARFNAGIAVAHGMPWQAALAAITVNPARVWGETKFGTLAPGQEADVVIWEGDPFEPLTQLDSVFIRGQEQSLESRHTLLRNRYNPSNISTSGLSD
jgi:imidazolonepropionase-like amidohydrolase